jgi:uncharacterized protein (TIGR02147 family)
MAEKSMNKKSDIAVFDYTDYRAYLHDYYKVKKTINKGFSYRSFAKRAGISSSGFYKEVLDGKRGLSRSLILKFSEAIGHSKKESEYFENMVYFNDSRTIEERKIYFGRMMAAYSSKAYIVESDQYEFYSKWYYSAIRELLSFYRFKDDYQALAKTLNPNIRPDQAKKAVDILEKLGFIKKDEDGYFSRVTPTITTGPEVQSLNVVNFQNTMMDLARQAIDRYPAKHRDMSTLTLSVSKELFLEMKSEIIAFRKKMLALEEKGTQPDRVYQLNFQFFPLSKIDGE